MSLMHISKLLRLIVIFGLTLTACQPTAIPPGGDILNNPTPDTHLLATEIVPSLEVIEIQGQETPTITEPAEETPLPTQEEEPLRLVLPEQGAVPVAAWRPPLYPTPWAPTAYDHFYFSRPIAADQINWPLADYRYGGIFLPEVVHTGVDIPAPFGTPVLSAGPGKVIWVGYGLFAQKEDPSDPYGLAIAIRHDFGYEGEALFTVYGHLSKANVAKGQHVEGGEIIGEVGDSGKTSGVHLHFEVRVGRNTFSGSRNPELWLAPPQGWGVLAARIMATNGLLLEHHTVIIRSYQNQQSWTVKSYGGISTNSDPYYLENMVIGDLPAGDYEVWVDYLGRTYDLDIQIQPGLVTFFSFRGSRGFNTFIPTPPGIDFTPEFVTSDGD